MKPQHPQPATPVLQDDEVLAVRNLGVRFVHDGQTTDAVRHLDFEVKRGETLAIVGESGSGKSVTSLALMRLVEQGGGELHQGAIHFRRRNGQQVNLTTARQSEMRKLRGADMAMIFQEPMTSLNPVFPVGEQIAESIRLHQGKDSAAASAEALRMLELVRIPEAKNILNSYPHQLSGGMRQRVMIAMALSCKPALLIADEPTTALDVTIQAQILQLIRVLQQEMQMAVIFITHDMGVVAEIADRVLVMYKGESVEEGDVSQIFNAPQHPYTRALLAAVPQLGAMKGTELPARFPLLAVTDNTAAGEPDADYQNTLIQTTLDPNAAPILQVRNLVTRFPLRSGWLNRVTRYVHAVEKVSFDLHPGETLALVGESGCGKSTTGRSLLRLVESQGGSVTFNGKTVFNGSYLEGNFSEDNILEGNFLKGRKAGQISASSLQHLRRDIQFIFQDPYASLDPRLTVGYSIMEPLLVHKIGTRQEVKARVAWLLEKVGLLPAHADRYPHEFSGGQRQRICIARALALNPKVVIADESVSALDVSIQAQIVNLLMDLQKEFGIAFLFISHDMAVVERISHRVAVMYLGQIVEIGPRAAVFENPQHPYTRKLLAAVPVASPEHRREEHALLADDIPSPIRPVGDEPIIAPLVEVSKGHFVARHAISSVY